MSMAGGQRQASTRASERDHGPQITVGFGSILNWLIALVGAYLERGGQSGSEPRGQRSYRCPSGSPRGPEGIVHGQHTTAGSGFWMLLSGIRQKTEKYGRKFSMIHGKSAAKRIEFVYSGDFMHVQCVA